MKTIHRIPTKQYAYMEFELGHKNPDEAHAEHLVFLDRFGGGGANDFALYVKKLFESDGKTWGDVDSFNERPQIQQEAIQEIKKFIKRKVK